ncbi:hypothetical protein H8356DRAFT_1071161 [Neocallimastix lanati (nom. inval.)]|nr:hypothetical protein H8356DRAFT_1071161 [Neocallimastix sp. JGI-2020a]
MTGILKNSKEQTNQKAFSPVPTADSFPWKKVNNGNTEFINSTSYYQNKIEPPKMDENKKDTLYSAYDSFLDDKRNTYLSESSYTFDTLNRNSYAEENEYEPIVEKQMAIITNEQPKPQRYSMLSALAPLTKHVSLDKPKLVQESHSQNQDSVRYTDEESSLYNDYSYVSYESDYEAGDENAQPLPKNQLDLKVDGINDATKSLEKKIEENIEKYKKEEENIYVSDSDSEIIEEDFSLRFQRDSVRESKDIVAEVVKQKLKEVNGKNEDNNKNDDDKEKKVEDAEKKEEKNEVKKSKGQLEREKAAKEAKEIEALKPSYVEQTNIKPIVNELTSNMFVDAEKDAIEKANESITNIKPQFVGNITIQPNVASLTSNMIKPPTQSIYVTSKEIASLGLNIDESSDKIEPKKDKGKERSDSDEEFYRANEDLRNLSLNDKKDDTSMTREINQNQNTPPVPKTSAPASAPAPAPAPEKKPLLTAPQIEPPRSMPHGQAGIPQFLLDTEKQYKVLDHPNPLIYSGYLEKLSTHGKFQRRLFRFDGLILTCLSQNKQKVPSNTSLLNFQPLFLQDGTQESFEFLGSIGRFYPNDPVNPELINPLVATEKQGNDYGIPDLKAHQYYYPKWMLNIHDIESIQPLLSIQTNNRNGEDLNNILRSNNQDQNENTFIITTNKISYILRAANSREFNRWMYLLNRMKETYIDLENEMMNPQPSVEGPKFKQFPPPPAYPPPPELQAKRYKNSQEYVENNLGFSLSFPSSAGASANKPLIAQICQDVRNPYYRRIALLKVWNVCFTDLLSIDTSVSINAVIIPINKQKPEGISNGFNGMNMNGPSGMGMGPAGMSGIPMGLMSPGMGQSGPSGKSGMMTPDMGPPKMKGMDGTPMGIMSPSMGPPGMNGTPMGIMSPSMGPPGMNGTPMGIMSPSMGPPGMNGMGKPMGMNMGTPKMKPNMNGMETPMGTPSMMSPNMGPPGMNMKPGMNNTPMGTPSMMSPSMGPPGMNMKSGMNNNAMGTPSMGPPGMNMKPGMNNNAMNSPSMMSPSMGPPGMKGTPMGVPGLMGMKKKSPLGEGNEFGELNGMSPMLNDSPLNMKYTPGGNGNNGRKESFGSDIRPNIKELMNYGNKGDDSDNEEEDRFYLPKKEDGTLRPFLGRNSVIGNTNSLLHFKKLSLMDVGGDFNSLYRALGNNNTDETSSPATKPKVSKQQSTDHFAQELEMLDKMNNKNNQQNDMSKLGIDSRQVNMTNIIPGKSKTQSMIQPEDSMMTEDIHLDFPVPPNPYSKIANDINEKNGMNANQKQQIAEPTHPQEKIEIPVDPELLHCLTAMLRIIHRLSGSCFREEQKSFESVPPPVPKWYYQFCVKSFPSFAKLTQTHVINYLECMEEKYTINGLKELPVEYMKIQESLESFIKATRAWERVVTDWKRDIIHRKHLNHKKIDFDDDDSIMKVVRINDVLRVNLLLKDHIEENARKETSKLRKFFLPPKQPSSLQK